MEKRGEASGRQRGRGPLGTIGSPVNQGINMLDTSPPRGNAFVTPGNIFLPLRSSPSFTFSPSRPRVLAILLPFIPLRPYDFRYGGPR